MAKLRLPPRRDDDDDDSAVAGRIDGSGGRGGGTFGGDDYDEVEHWHRIRVCRGHGLDAVVLAWAPDDSHLVSCSLDSRTPVIVWRLDLEEDDVQCEYQDDDDADDRGRNRGRIRRR